MPFQLEDKAAQVKNFDDREIRSIFLGTIHNEVQQRYRSVDFSKEIEIFEVFSGLSRYEYPYSRDEYYSLMENSKFSLSLRGFGAKAFREIESLALGSVLLLDDSLVDTKNYKNPLERGVHYLNHKSQEDLLKIQNSISAQEWKKISDAGRDWYWENSSLEGAFSIFFVL